MVSAHDADGTFQYVSPRIGQLLGETPDALIGRHPREFAHPDDVASVVAFFRRVSDNKQGATTVWRWRRPSGLYGWVESTARAATRDGKSYIACGSRDVTERRQIEDALRESESRFRSTVETVRLVAVGLDVNARITFCNDSLCTLLGYSRSELLGENWFEKVLPPDSQSRAAFFENIKADAVRPKAENEVVCRDGSRRTIEWDNTVLRNADGQILGTASLGADVTDRRQEEATLKLLQSTALSISGAKDIESALALTLEALCNATGWAYGEAWCREEDSSVLSRTTHHSTLGTKAKRLVDAGANLKFAIGDGLPGRAWAIRDVVWVPDIATVGELSGMQRSRDALDSGFQAAVAIPVMSGGDVVALLEFFMDRPRATDLRHTQMVEVIANQAGSLIARRLEQKRHEAELTRARDEAEAASHAKSDFLSRMSHELRTPLNSVIGFANVLKKNKTGRMGADDLAFLDRITANGKHLLSLVNDVLDIAKIEAGRLTVTTGMVNLDNLIVDVVNSLEGQSRAPGVELRAEVCDVMPIESDPVLLKQVLINLTSNALRFTEKGSVVVKLEVDKNENPLRIRVVDTGIGIPAELHDRIFEPFEQAEDTTHLKYGGTGLGLSISRSICEALGFKLSVESEPNKGSTFTVHLTP